MTRTKQTRRVVPKGLARATSDPRYVCYHCQKKFGYKSGLRKHTCPQVRFNRLHYCPYCTMTSHHQDSVRRHLRQFHPSKDTEIGIQNSDFNPKKNSTTPAPWKGTPESTTILEQELAACTITNLEPAASASSSNSSINETEQAMGQAILSALLPRPRKPPIAISTSLAEDLALSTSSSSSPSSSATSLWGLRASPPEGAVRSPPSKSGQCLPVRGGGGPNIHSSEVMETHSEKTEPNSGDKETVTPTWKSEDLLVPSKISNLPNIHSSEPMEIDSEKTETNSKDKGADLEVRRPTGHSRQDQQATLRQATEARSTLGDRPHLPSVHIHRPGGSL